jgi:hypothetical protein
MSNSIIDSIGVESIAANAAATEVLAAARAAADSTEAIFVPRTSVPTAHVMSSDSDGDIVQIEIADAMDAPMTTSPPVHLVPMAAVPRVQAADHIASANVLAQVSKRMEVDNEALRALVLKMSEEHHTLQGELDRTRRTLVEDSVLLRNELDSLKQQFVSLKRARDILQVDLERTEKAEMATSLERDRLHTSARTHASEIQEYERHIFSLNETVEHLRSQVPLEVRVEPSQMDAVITPTTAESKQDSESTSLHTSAAKYVESIQDPCVPLEARVKFLESERIQTKELHAKELDKVTTTLVGIIVHLLKTIEAEKPLTVLSRFPEVQLSPVVLVRKVLRVLTNGGILPMEPGMTMDGMPHCLEYVNLAYKGLHGVSHVARPVFVVNNLSKVVQACCNWLVKDNNLGTLVYDLVDADS